MALLVVSIGLATACSQSTHIAATQDDAIVSVPQTQVERASIGDSWLYAEANWIGALSGGAIAPSPAYWSYWHAFDQITDGFATRIATGGNWQTANELVLHYGLVPAASFASSATPDDASARRDAALAAIDASLTSGPLADPSARRDRALVRRELDRAWNLGDDERAMLDRVFGTTVSRAFSAPGEPADPTGTPIASAASVAVAYTTGPGTARADKRLVDAIHEWHVVYYADADRAAFLRQVQKALNDGEPVLLTWFVDFDALEDRDNGRRGAFNLATLDELGPGTQGGDTALVSGYQVRLADGQIVSIDAAQPGDTSATLDAAAAVQLFRVLGPWGAARPARYLAAGAPAQVDLWLDYLDGPIKRCAVPGGATDTTSCLYAQIPLQDVVLPPGY